MSFEDAVRAGLDPSTLECPPVPREGVERLVAVGKRDALEVPSQVAVPMQQGVRENAALERFAVEKRRDLFDPPLTKPALPLTLGRGLPLRV